MPLRIQLELLAPDIEVAITSPDFFPRSVLRMLPIDIQHVVPLS